MSLGQPKVRWYDANNAQAVSEWNAGVVDAGYWSRPDDPTVADDPLFPSTFLIWNNRFDAALNPDGATTDVNDMTNVTITTLSLVRDTQGNIDPNLSYLPGGAAGTPQNAVAGKEQAIVEVIFYDSSKPEWGSYDTDGLTWRANTWRPVGGNDKTYVVSASGAKATLKGTKNNASLTVDKANYSKIKMRLHVLSNATAGKVEWVTRCSYQYSQ